MVLVNLLYHIGLDWRPCGGERTQSPVAFAMSSPTFLGDRPSGPILGASADEAPTSPPVARRWITLTSLGSNLGGMAAVLRARRWWQDGRRLGGMCSVGGGKLGESGLFRMWCSVGKSWPLGSTSKPRQAVRVKDRHPPVSERVLLSSSFQRISKVARLGRLVFRPFSLRDCPFCTSSTPERKAFTAGERFLLCSSLRRIYETFLFRKLRFQRQSNSWPSNLPLRNHILLEVTGQLNTPSEMLVTDPRGVAIKGFLSRDGLYRRVRPWRLLLVVRHICADSHLQSSLADPQAGHLHIFD